MVIGQRRHSKMAVTIAFGFFFVATVCVPEETKQFINQLNHGSLSIRMNAANNLEKLGLQKDQITQLIADGVMIAD
mgnify:CR=1 FL=1